MFVSLVSVLIKLVKIGGKYYPQVYLKQCKCKVKKREMKNFIDFEIDLNCDYESD